MPRNGSLCTWFSATFGIDDDQAEAALRFAIERGCLKVVVSRSGCPSKPNHVGAEK
jgi:hypothetical protein